MYILIAFAYLIGSIPFSVIISKFFYGIDIRNYGSKNAGASNTYRTIGFWPGISVLLLDISKGFLAMFLQHFCKQDITLYIGLSVVIGHIFPIYLKFKGGKGVATLFGTILYLSPIGFIFCATTYIIILSIYKIASLSSLFAIFMFAMSFVYPKYGFLMFIIILITHRKNILRLLKGTEKRLF